MGVLTRKDGYGVTCYEGMWASGKTLAMARECLNLQKQGVLIATNFGFYTQDYKLRTARDWLGLIDEAMNVPAKERPRIHFAIDEMGMLFRARDYGKYPGALDVVFQQGRKFKISLSYTVPDFELVDSNIRRVTARVVRCAGYFERNISPKGEAPELCPRVFTRSEYKPGQSKKARAERLERKIVFFDREAGESYDTYAVVSSVQAALHEQMSDMDRERVVAVAV